MSELSKPCQYYKYTFLVVRKYALYGIEIIIKVVVVWAGLGQSV